MTKLNGMSDSSLRHRSHPAIFDSAVRMVAGSTVTNSMPWSSQQVRAVEAALYGPLTGFSIATQDVALAFRGTNFEILRVWVVPAIFDGVDVMDILDSILSNRRVQRKATRSLVGFVAGVCLDVDGERHPEIVECGYKRI